MQLLGLALVLAGIGIIFAGELELLPRDALTSAIGGGVMALGFLIHVRGRATKA